MRGFLFEITENKENIGNLTADDFSCTRDGSSFAEWYEDLDKEELLGTAYEPSADYGIESGRDEDGSLYFVFGPDTKEKFFTKRFERFKEEVVHMTLEKFASENVYELQLSIEDGYDDAVYLADEEYAVTMDNVKVITNPSQMTKPLSWTAVNDAWKERLENGNVW